MTGSSEETARRLAVFQETTRGLSYEPRGVLFSEIYFIRQHVPHFPVSRIIESGRARGQSTLLFALCFPESEIISVDYEPGTPDAAFAEDRLAAFPKVKLLYGDAFDILPTTVQSGDIVFIDGPKGFRALRLAFMLFRGGFSPAGVFLHDFCKGLPEREFLERRYPGVKFSDDPDFSVVARVLDENCLNRDMDGNGLAWQPHFFNGRRQESYGPTVAFLPPIEAGVAAGLLRQTRLASVVGRVKRSLNKRLGHCDPLEV